MKVSSSVRAFIERTIKISGLRISAMTIAGLFGLGLALSSAPALAGPILNIDSDGQLTGVSGLLVGDMLFDVDFGDGSCISLFNGCDSAEDFDLKNDIDADLARQALVEQVFLDSELGMFNSDPTLTKGCEYSVLCQIIAPFGEFILGHQSVLFVKMVRVDNRADNTLDLSLLSTITLDVDLTNATASTFARFTKTEIPEPASMALFGLGLVSLLAGRQRRRQHPVDETRRSPNRIV